MVDSMTWNKRRTDRDQRLSATRGLASGKIVGAGDVTALLEAVLRPGDRVCIEGDNQKQADFLAKALTGCDPARVFDLHMVQSGIVLPAHLDVFERKIARRLDYSYSGPQSARMARMLYAGQIELGAVHTYLELFARYFIDLTPQVALIAAVSADRDGNLYTGPNTEDTPTIVEATAFHDGIVIAQVNEILDRVPRVDIPGDRVHFITRSPSAFFVEPLFTRDPAAITESQILMAMMVIKGIYAEYGVERLNHGIGFGAAAIELILPTYGEAMGLKGKIATHWALNPHPTLIPAIESGWVAADTLLRFRSRHGSLYGCAAGYLFHRSGWFAALQPRHVSDRRTVCLRSVHRLDTAGGYPGSQFNRDRIACRRIWRRAKYGFGSSRPTSSIGKLDQGWTRSQSRWSHEADARAKAGGAIAGDLR
jgi:malonate decarboxylase alpha subunit